MSKEPHFVSAVFSTGCETSRCQTTDWTDSACGVMVAEALAAAELLAAEGVSAEVLDAMSIKPLDAERMAGLIDDGGGDQRRLYDLVARRFLAVFLPPRVTDETVALVAGGLSADLVPGVKIITLPTLAMEMPSRETITL